MKAFIDSSVRGIINFSPDYHDQQIDFTTFISRISGRTKMIYTFIQKIFPPKLEYRNFIFIPLFFSFYLTLRLFELASFQLEQFTGRSVSAATLEGIDIGKRVSTFYGCTFFTAIILILFTRFMVFFRQFVNEKELSIANGLSLTGFCLLFFQLLGADMSASLHFIFALLIICATGFIFNLLKKRDERDLLLAFTWSSLVAVSIFFLQWQLIYFLCNRIIFSLPVILCVSGIPIYFLFTTNRTLNFRIIRSSQPLAFIPLLSFFAVEISMILNQHGYYLSPELIYLIGLALIFVRVFQLYSKTKYIHTDQELIPMLFRKWMPLVLTGILFIAFYRPVVNTGVDLFEDANHILPMQQWLSFGKIPFLNTFSGHALSDSFFSMLFVFFNGANPMGFFVYRFMLVVIGLLIIYFFVYKINRDKRIYIWKSKR